MHFPSAVTAALAPDIEAHEVATGLIEPQIDAADFLAPTLENMAKLPQPSDAACQVIGDQADALAVVCLMWRAYYVR